MSTATPKPSRTYRGQAAEDRSAERRRKLVAAGIELFGTQGFAATTVRQICAEAGLTERYFYESFENRDELFTAVASECVTGLVGALVLARTQAAPELEAQVDAMLRVFFEWFRSDPRRTRIQLFEPLLISEDFQRLYREVTSFFVAMARDVALPFYGESIVRRELDANLLATGLVGAAIEVVKEWALTGYERPLEDVLRNTRFLFLAAARSITSPPV